MCRPLLPPTKEEVNAFARVRLSVCLSVSKITQKCVHGFGWNVARVDRTDVGTWTNWLTFEPDPDYTPDAGTGLLSPISYALQRGYYVGKIPRIRIQWRPSLQRCVILKWFYSPRAVGTTLFVRHACNTCNLMNCDRRLWFVRSQDIVHMLYAVPWNWRSSIDYIHITVTTSQVWQFAGS